MSGIYIPGKEMPKCCAECFCMDEEDLFCRITESAVGGKPDLNSWNPRPDNCPLIPVPDHGRLVDADALTALMFADPYQDFVHIIEQMPTVIPADEEAEE